MPTNKPGYMDEYRRKLAKDGLKRRDIALTDEEFKKVKEYLNRLRREQGA